MTKKDFIQRVLLIMNEAGMFDQAGNSFIGADSAQVDRHIEGSYVDAWRRCTGVLPKAWFKNASFKNYPIVINSAEGIGYIVLPDDFYLLTSLQMVGWNKPIFELSTENERTSIIQSNEYTRGSSIRPAGVASNKEPNVPIESIIVVGTEPISGLSPMDNGVFYCLLNKITYEWIDEIFNYKGIGNNTQSYARNDMVYNAQTTHLMICETETIGINDYAKWTIVSEPITPPHITLAKGLIYQDVYTKKIYTSTSTSTIEQLDITFGINQVLNYYSLQKGLQTHAIETALYVPAAKPISAYNDDQDLGLDQRIIEPLAYLSASTVFTIFEKYPVAQALEARVAEMFPGFKSVRGTNVTIKQ